MRTGPLVSALADGVKEDLSDVLVAIEALKEQIQQLGESARAINGLGTDCAGWADRLMTMAAEVKKEYDEVPSKLLGKKRVEILTHTNHELAEQVRQARGDG